MDATSSSLMKILALLSVVCYIVVLSSTVLVDAGGIYHVSHWDEEVVIKEDASLVITENVTFRFVSGDFGYAYRSIPHRGFDDMISITVTDDEGYVLGYNLEKGNNYEVRWEWERIYVGPNPIEKTFRLYYTLTNAMNYENADPDRDRFYWNIVTDYEVDIHDMNLDVILPGLYNQSSISATSYYSISPTSPPEITNSTTNTILSYHHPKVEAGEDYTLDVYFPATVERPPPTLFQILSAHLDLVAPWYSVGMIALGIVAIVKVRSFRRGFRDPEITAIEMWGDQPPTDIRPPEAGVLSDMKVWRKHFDSALLDLAQRGYLNMYVESKEVGLLRKSVKVESFEVKLSEKGKNALRSRDPDLRRYEWNLLERIDAMPINKEELRRLKREDVRRRFGLETVKDDLIEKGLVDPKGFEKKGTHLVILGGALFLLGVAVVILFLLVGSANWWMCITTFFPAITFGVAGTIGPRTVQGAKLRKQTRGFLDEKMRELKENAEVSPLSTIQQINELSPWLVLHPTFYSLISTPAKAMKSLDTTGKQQTDILPSYMKVIGSSCETMPIWYYYYSLWCTFYATASPSTGAPPSGGGAGGGAGGGGGGGGGGAG